MAIVAGNTVYWTSNGATLSGVVVSTPTLNANGTANQEGGEPVYVIKSVTGPGAPANASALVNIRSTEVRASA